jgi:parallel beta-helix repeat protein
MRNGLILNVTVLVFCFILISSPIVCRGEKPIRSNILQSFGGRTVYVGGNGPGNYSKIQDAIDNATNDDTIFVYHYSSPYYENILINKSITLLGENKTTTAIDAQGVGGNAVSITEGGVTFSGFSVLNWAGNTSSNGIFIYADNCAIIGNILSCTHIWYGYEALRLYRSKNNSIMNNIITHADHGILMEHSSRNIISKNLIMDCWGFAIQLRFSNDNNIFENIIVNNSYGIDVGDSMNNKINSNEISHNTYGITISYSLKNIIMKNNFRKNFDYDAYNVFSFQPFWRNTWNDNYWNRARLLPKVIFGYLEYHKDRFIIIPWMNVDWHPAQKPYNISILN